MKKLLKKIDICKMQFISTRFTLPKSNTLLLGNNVRITRSPGNIINKHFLSSLQVPESHSDTTWETTKRRNGEQITYHNSHPHHQIGSLRGGFGVGDHFGKNPHHSQRVPSLCTNEQSKNAKGNFSLSGYEYVF